MDFRQIIAILMHASCALMQATASDPSLTYVTQHKVPHIENGGKLQKVRILYAANDHSLIIHTTQNDLKKQTSGLSSYDIEHEKFRFTIKIAASLEKFTPKCFSNGSILFETSRGLSLLRNFDKHDVEMVNLSTDSMIDSRLFGLDESVDQIASYSITSKRISIGKIVRAQSRNKVEYNISITPDDSFFTSHILTSSSGYRNGILYSVTTAGDQNDGYKLNCWRKESAMSTRILTTEYNFKVEPRVAAVADDNSLIFGNADGSLIRYSLSDGKTITAEVSMLAVCDVLCIPNSDKIIVLLNTSSENLLLVCADTLKPLAKFTVDAKNLVHMSYSLKNELLFLASTDSIFVFKSKNFVIK